MAAVAWGIAIVVAALIVAALIVAALIAVKKARQAACISEAQVHALQEEVITLKKAVDATKEEACFYEECSPQHVIAELHASLSAPRRRLEVDWDDE